VRQYDPGQADVALKGLLRMNFVSPEVAQANDLEPLSLHLMFRALVVQHAQTRRPDQVLYLTRGKPGAAPDGPLATIVIAHRCERRSHQWQTGEGGAIPHRIIVIAVRHQVTGDADQVRLLRHGHVDGGFDDSIWHHCGGVEVGDVDQANRPGAAEASHGAYDGGELEPGGFEPVGPGSTSTEGG
jgi:hypothetical protein